MSARKTPLQETTDNQRRAADPAKSVFVMANAGSGKTRVLTNRVARLLLSDVRPQRILCITFTKAAAAEMAERLFAVLGEWALASDEKLLSDLGELEGEGSPERSAEDLAKARRLFARALETPGGLKIQTIHSFCESVLRRFPIEAGAPPGFQVVEDAQAATLLSDALDSLAVTARTDTSVAADFDRLSRKRNESDLRALLLGAARQSAPNDIESAAADLASALSIDPSDSESEIKKTFLEALNPEQLKRAQAGLAAEGVKPKEAAERLSAFFAACDDEGRWRSLCEFFLTAAGTPRKSIATKATDKHDSWVAPFLDELQSTFVGALDELKSHSLYADTVALWRLGAGLNAKYGAAKSARAMLDFDDLIERVKILFTRVESDWVMYKLDAGIDHVLIDEAQDTSPGQWAVVESLFADFFSGAGARTSPRSFFAVGDLKQSIYSFQGADVGLFREKEQLLGKKLAAITAYENLQLPMSFRTTAPVLAFVDAAFDDPAAADGLGEFPIPAHGVKREGEAGLVELWPLTPRPSTPEINPWDAPVDALEASHPVRLLSDRVAATIKGWLDTREVLESKGRPIEAGDIMILVQSRGALFREVIQRLSATGVPVAGPDRLKLAEDPAVEDLMSLALFALTRNDDLSLAEVLKSPLFGFDDDADLFPLAHEREKHETLWASLRRRQEEQPHWRRAVTELQSACNIATAHGPYAFFSHVLETGSPSGRKRFFSRLGETSSDAIDELLRQALDFENGEPRSLREFVAWFDGRSADIKRELERDNNAVRVMTVHGAKGLEGDIVFLLDGHREPNAGAKDPLLQPARDSGLKTDARLLAWSKADDVPLSEAARTEKSRLIYEEYRRLFYVAATRARDRLYICGIEQGRSKNPQDKPVGLKSWHSLALDAFDRLGGEVEHDPAPFWPDSSEASRRLSCNQTAAIKSAPQQSAKSAVSPPAWIKTNPPREAPALRLSPSRLSVEEAEAQVYDAAYSPVVGESVGSDPYARGRTLHRLLELLPGVAPDRRSQTADRLLSRLAPDTSADERGRWRDEVMRVLTDPQFSEVFAPGSLAEASIVGVPKGAPTNARISGQIDRLAISPSRVLVVDYKTNRPPPKDVRDADPAYIAQLAAYRSLLQEIYPDRQIDCALLWTFDARLMEAPSPMLDHAFARIQKAG